mmetsp:Transcript_43602/g.78251  ORF Transcript_43602/g.78251 Transcript_43602/m.78251 type:complete len:208 (-) Transcript_43602:1408-2031(-)
MQRDVRDDFSVIVHCDLFLKTNLANLFIVPSSTTATAATPPSIVPPPEPLRNRSDGTLDHRSRHTLCDGAFELDAPRGQCANLSGAEALCRLFTSSGTSVARGGRRGRSGDGFVDYVKLHILSFLQHCIPTNITSITILRQNVRNMKINLLHPRRTPQKPKVALNTHDPAPLQRGILQHLGLALLLPSLPLRSHQRDIPRVLLGGAS